MRVRKYGVFRPIDLRNPPSYDRRTIIAAVINARRAVEPKPWVRLMDDAGNKLLDVNGVKLYAG